MVNLREGNEEPVYSAIGRADVLWGAPMPVVIHGPGRLSDSRWLGQPLVAGLVCLHFRYGRPQCRDFGAQRSEFRDDLDQSFCGVRRIRRA